METKASLKEMYYQAIFRLKQFVTIAAENREHIIGDRLLYGETEQEALQRFRESIEIKFFNSINPEEFARVYKVYEDNFPIKDERELPSGFITVASFNTNQEMQQKYGAFEEAWNYAKDQRTGRIIGGVNYITFDLAKDEVMRPYLQKVKGSQHLMYLFVAPEYRMLGIAKMLVKAAKKQSREFLEGINGPGDGKILYTFNELNNPFKMKIYEYLVDTIGAGIRQYDRLAWWRRRGFRSLDFPYVAPALDESVGKCEMFDLNVSGDKGNQFEVIPAAIVKAHLYRFFSIKLFKNRPAETDPDWRLQEEFLNSDELVKIRTTENLQNDSKRVEDLIFTLAEEDAKWPEESIGKLLKRFRSTIRPRTVLTSSFFQSNKINRPTV